MIHLYFFSIWKHLPSWKTTKCIELGKQVQKVNFCDNIVGYNTQTSTESYLKIQNILKPLGPTKWVSWDETGYGAPETQHAPVVYVVMMAIFTIYGKQPVIRFQTLGGGAHGVCGIRLVTRFQWLTPLLIL